MTIIDIVESLLVCPRTISVVTDGLISIREEPTKKREGKRFICLRKDSNSSRAVYSVTASQVRKLTGRFFQIPQLQVLPALPVVMLQERLGDERAVRF